MSPDTVSCRRAHATVCSTLTHVCARARGLPAAAGSLWVRALKRGNEGAEEAARLHIYG